MSADQWETITTSHAFTGQRGGWYGSKPPESVASDEPDYEHAAMRARLDSLLPRVHDAQVIRNGRSVETWTDGKILPETELEAGQ
jgi:hypothetical protein